MIEHFPILHVVIPMLAAPLCLILARREWAAIVATAASAAAFAIAVTLLMQVNAGGVISYAVGGWPPPWGIEVRVDHASALLLVIVSGISALVMPFAYQSVAREVKTELQPLFYTAHLLCLTGLLGIVVTGDAFNLFVFLEISSLATYALVSLSNDRRALTAAYRYLIMGTIGATFILIGVGLLYMKTGTLNMLDLADRAPIDEGSRAVKTALAFILVGVSLKLALFPLHLWLPAAYTYAPSAVSAFLAATATKVAVYVLLRFIFTLFGSDFVFDAMAMDSILMALAMIAILVGSLQAIFQHNAKTLLAYSSLAQIGYMVLGISVATVTGITASLLHVFNHALMKVALFMAMGAVFYRLGSVQISALRGMGRQMPITMAAFTLGGLSLIGVPLTVGFVSKWYLVLAVLEIGAWWLAAFILIGSLLALVYVWRVVEAAYFQPADPNREPVREAPWTMLVPLLLVVAANLYFGIDTRLTVSNAEEAALWLLQQEPGGRP